MRYVALLFVLGAILPEVARAQAPTPEKVAAELHSAFVQADFRRMSTYLADTLLFDGEVEVVTIARQGTDRTHTAREFNEGITARDENQRLGPGWVSVTATRDGLVSSYEKLIERIGRDRWTSIMRSTEPSIVRVEADGASYRYSKAGDVIVRFFVRNPTRANVNSLDEAVLFILRRANGSYRVVAHFADM
jgi:hypothetical protein